jgi:Eco57I restriction-modification methylase
MRKASSAPRNSRELAVRNQLFTPRYVVEFLTDNSLGRLWYEMREGKTALAASCRYLVCRPDEVFLGPGDDHAAHPGTSVIPFRAKKDPRDLKILDPACGSGHFLLYAFDLLLVIYREAWADAESPRSEVTGTTLAEDYRSEAELERAIPELILRHNLHGIDIDPRAAQIAALALWLRAQRAWRDQRLKPAERPRVVRTHIVCAEPMPGEKETLADFAGQLRPPVLGQLIQVVFERMRLAGEAGCLLRIEEEIRTAVETARGQWLEGGRPEQIELFPELAGPKQQELRFDLSGVTRDAFWDQAEGRILSGLHRYAEEADLGVDMGRRMFADDAAAGFAFIDLCRQRFDVVVMNPPFGAASTRSKDYIAKHYPRSKNDLLAACVERGIGWLHPGGLLGAITSRTAFFLTSFRHWRQGVVLGDAKPLVMADLGHGVMDAAMVEAAAYVLRKR